MSRITVTPESEACVVEGLAVVYGMVNPSHTFSMPHITLSNLQHSITIQVSLSLENCAITDRHCSNYFLSKITDLTTEIEACVVESLAVVYVMVNPSHLFSMPHITLPSL